MMQAIFENICHVLDVSITQMYSLKFSHSEHKQHYPFTNKKPKHGAINVSSFVSSQS